MPATLFPVTVFLHYCSDMEGGCRENEELKHEELKFDCKTEAAAARLTRSIYHGRLTSAPVALRRRAAELGITEGLAVSGALSVSHDALSTYAPDLLD